jgi:hypothetical protein
MLVAGSPDIPTELASGDTAANGRINVRTRDGRRFYRFPEINTLKSRRHNEKAD